MKRKSGFRFITSPVMARRSLAAGGGLPGLLELAAREERREVRAQLAEGLLHPCPAAVLLAVDEHHRAEHAEPLVTALPHRVDHGPAARDHVLDHDHGIARLC